MDPCKAVRKKEKKERKKQAGEGGLTAACKSDEGALWELRPKSTCIPVTLSAIIGCRNAD